MSGMPDREERSGVCSLAFPHPASGDPGVQEASQTPERSSLVSNRTLARVRW
jgi:hypothetical protein